ncbi:helix-turn-helix domain-containing protein [Roseibium sp.]|uniref:helix-turn-helix domain-containing protein n=1 Tax=Roseibium sp. TaxID=1936156 RepID=UPI003C7C8D82
MPDVVSTRTVLPAGGGAYALPSLTLGIFLNDQPGHRLAHGSSQAAHRPLSKNQGWILPAGSEGLCEYDAELEFVSVSLSHTLLEEFGIGRSFEFEAVVGALDPLLLSLSLSADSFEGNGALYRDTMQRALAAQLIQSVKPLPAWNAGIEDARLRRVLDHIHDNLAKDLSLTAMAELAAMSSTHFSKAFKKALGQSPLQYVIKARLERASVLLKTTQLSVAEVAWRCGYQDLSRFGQHFKRLYGATPAVFRSG